MKTNPTLTLAEEIDGLVKQLIIYGAGDLTTDEAVTKARTALLARIESVGQEVIGEDFDVSKIPFGSAQIEAIVANRVKVEQHTRLALIVGGK